MTGEARQPRRGPKPKPDRGESIGFRLNSRIRFELQVAATFVGTKSHQETIDVAVGDFLNNLRATASGYVEALEAAEKHQRKRAGVLDLPAGNS